MGGDRGRQAPDLHGAPRLGRVRRRVEVGRDPAEHDRVAGAGDHDREAVVGAEAVDSGWVETLHEQEPAAGRVRRVHGRGARRREIERRLRPDEPAETPGRDLADAVSGDDAAAGKRSPSTVWIASGSSVQRIWSARLSWRPPPPRTRSRGSTSPRSMRV